MSHNVTQSLSAKQFQAAWFLGRGLKVSRVARWLKVRRETVSRWKKIPAFQAEVARFAEEHRQVLAWQMAEVVQTSVEEIDRHLRSTDGDKRLHTALAVVKQIGMERFKLLMAANGVEV